MKLLRTLPAICSCLTAYTSAALAADVSSEVTTETAADPSVSGMLPAEQSEGNADPTADQDVSASSDANAKPEREAKNAIYADLAGPGLFYSLNYDRVIVDDFSARIGFSYLSMGASASGGGTSVSAEFSYLAIPITASYLGIGSENNMLELGAGAVIMNITGEGIVDGESGGGSLTTAVATAMVGYRHQPADGGFVFRIGLSPMVGAFVLPWGYLSLGAAF